MDMDGLKIVFDEAGEAQAPAQQMGTCFSTLCTYARSIDIAPGLPQQWCHWDKEPVPVMEHFHSKFRRCPAGRWFMASQPISKEIEDEAS